MSGSTQKSTLTDVTANAIALQERDSFREQGWLKLISPAKVNLHLAIGSKRADGYHEAVTIMQALNLHDVVYMRRKPEDAADPDKPTIRMVSCGDVEAPDISSEDNIAYKAIVALANELGRRDAGIEVRIEKSIPAAGGLGGGSSNAAAALVGACGIWGIAPDDAVERVARGLGADVAFFLRGGCSYHVGTGDEFVRSLAPSKRAVALVKPQGGVSTAQAYSVFDAQPVAVPREFVDNASCAERADDVMPFNNLAHASESIMPVLAEVREWMGQQPGVSSALLCGSGATTFAPCDDFAAACEVVAAARKRGWWGRATSFGSVRVMAVSS